MNACESVSVDSNKNFQTSAKQMQTLRKQKAQSYQNVT